MDVLFCAELLKLLQHQFVAFSVTSACSDDAVNEADESCCFLFNCIHSGCYWLTDDFHDFLVLLCAY